MTVIIDTKQAEDPAAEHWPTCLSYWRRFGAEAFDAEVRAEVAACVADITSTMPAWRSAVRGDAAAATALALRLRKVTHISPRIDLVMTVVLRCAFENAGAALALSHAIRKMPLDRRVRGRLAKSWLLHNIWLAHRPRTLGRRSVALRCGRSGE